VNKLIAIIGPTAVGKTRLAIHLASRFNGEIINADSRQIYRKMDIGTAKPNKNELASLPHHLIDIIEPTKEFSLAEYQQLANDAIEDIQSRGKIPFLVGGSGLYVWAVLEGWVIPKVAPDAAFRLELEKRAENGEGSNLFAELTSIDPASAEKIDPKNVRRVIRALEINKQSDRKFSQLRKKNPPGFETLSIGLTAARNELYHSADARVDSMIMHGFINEVDSLIKMGYSPDLPAMSGIGYREIALYLQGGTTLEEAIYKIKTGTHRFIRHQYAWFRLKDERIKWFDVETNNETEIDRVVRGFLE
jgi:tRNA dimethylallyltransferase